MNPDLSEKVSNKIESLCESGCTQINQLLEKAGRGDSIEELTDYSPVECKQIVNELKKIMAVYEKKDAE